MTTFYTGTGSSQLRQHIISIPTYLVLSIFTVGIWDAYWNSREMQACNDLVGRIEFNWWTWALLNLVTCGIYNVFYQYNMATVLVEAQRKYGQPVFDSLPVASVIVSVFGGSLIVDCIHQHEINKLCSVETSFQTSSRTF